MDCGSCNQPIHITAGRTTCNNFLLDEYGNPSQDLCAALLPAQVLTGRWEIEKCIGVGGQGRTYLANDKNMKRQVVVKELINPTENPHSTLEQQKEYQGSEFRFEREAQHLMNLSHKRIPQIYDLFQGGQPPRRYICMEFIAGESLEKTLHGFPNGVSEDQAIKWAIQILEVLECIHNHKDAKGQPEPICHRDLKPANVMVRQGSEELVLIDFGIARAQTTQSQKTVSLGTGAYAGREIYEGRLEPRTDLFALGAMMYEFVTGKLPSSAVDINAKQTNFKKLALVKPGLDPKLAHIIEKATQFEEHQRYATATEMRDALIALSLPHQTAPPPPIGGTTIKLPSPPRGNHQSVETIKLPPVGPVYTPPVVPTIPTWPIPPTFGGGTLVYVPPGPFLMGTTTQEIQQLFMRFPGMVYEQELFAEYPKTTEVIDGRGFWISTNVVTNAQYQIFLAANPHIPVPASEASRMVVSNAYAPAGAIDADKYDWSPGRRTPPRGQEMHPVVNITWNEAYAYARWMGCRLPTEREWERAARGTDGRPFPWGFDETPNKCHCRLSGAVETCAVGQYAVGMSPAGCFDMAGNVRQWTGDPWRPYPSNPNWHPNYANQWIVTRGSSWQERSIPRLRCTFRNCADPNQRSAVVGFRIVRDVV